MQGFIARLVCKIIDLIVALVYFKVSDKALPFSIKFATTDSGKLIMPPTWQVAYYEEDRKHNYKQL